MTEHECEKFGKMLVLREAADENDTDQNATPIDEEPTVNTIQLERVFKMSEKRISLGINVSILVILTIFGVLLSLPLRMLLNTNYDSRNQTIGENCATGTTENATTDEMIVIPIDYRKLKRCPKFEYKDLLQSVFRSDYDGNCTYTRIYATDDSEEDENENATKSISDNGDTSMVSKEIVGENFTENTEESGKDRRMKSAPVAGHILVTMLLISAIAALVEVLRIRFARDKVLQRRPH